MLFVILCLQNIEKDDSYSNDKAKPDVNQNKYLLYSIIAIIFMVVYCK